MFRARPARAPFLSPYQLLVGEAHLRVLRYRATAEAAGKSPRHDIPVALPAARYPNTFKSRPISHFP
jgi:hypothetical protein